MYRETLEASRNGIGPGVRRKPTLPGLEGALPALCD